MFTAVCAAVTLLGLRFCGVPFDWRYGLLIGYFAVMTGVLVWWQERSVGKASSFIRRFMAGLVGKLMGSLVLLAILVKTAPEDLIAPLALVFAGAYMAFLGFSVARLMTAVKRAAN